MTTYGWPLLITRGRDTGYQVVVHPPQFAGVPGARLLERHTAGDPSPVRAESVADPRGVLVFVTETALAETWALPGQGLLTDRHGRPFTAVLGVFVPDVPGVDAGGVTERDLSSWRAAVVADFHRLWAAPEPIPARASTPMPLALPAAPARPAHPVAAKRRRRPMRGPAAVLLGVAVLLGALLWFLQRDTGRAELSASVPPQRWVRVDEAALTVLPAGDGTADFAVTATRVTAVAPATAAPCGTDRPATAATTFCGTTRSGDAVRVSVRKDPRNPANVLVTVDFG